MCKRCKGKSALCSTCRSAKTRAADPVRASYIARKHNAKTRGKAFEITLEQFREWCVKVNYVGMKRGRGADCYTVDRIDESKGYTIDNIQLITNADNVKKYVNYCYQSKTVTISGPAPQEKDLPF